MSTTTNPGLTDTVVRAQTVQQPGDPMSVVFSSPAFLAGRAIELTLSGIAMALHLSGAKPDRRATVADTARAVVAALNVFGPFEIERRATAERRRILAGEPGEWSARRSQLCADLAWRLAGAVDPTWLTNTAPMTPWVELTATGTPSGTGLAAVAA
ncbi:hypothetical protein [Actinosynnema sp. NPDC023587]|uniref:hypothetical protein n=1 Tax=Actinosynnema sp. NPDC023587 TaxID=3154695 RepID=UPI003401D425